MNDIDKVNLRKARDWLSGDVEVRVPKAWLAIGGAVFAVLFLLAFD